MHFELDYQSNNPISSDSGCSPSSRRPPSSPLPLLTIVQMLLPLPKTLHSRPPILMPSPPPQPKRKLIKYILQPRKPSRRDLAPLVCCKILLVREKRAEKGADLAGRVLLVSPRGQNLANL
jgi:hypothetical protein